MPWDLPRTVEVGGEEVAIKVGFRSAVASYRIDPLDPDGPAMLLSLFYGGRSCDPREVPAACSSMWREALLAAYRWRDGAWDALPYGRVGGPGGGRRVFDFDADWGVVAADFQRLYSIDLTSPATQVHWWRFVALLESAARTEGALLRDAVAARSPQPRARTSDARRRQDALRAMWELPPSAEEARARAMAEFGR